jgi:hypothetical protein
MTRSRRGRHLDHKYPLVRYRFDRVGWLRLQAAQRLDLAHRRTVALVSDGAEGVRTAAARWRRAGADALAAVRRVPASVARLDGAGDGAAPELGVPFSPTPAPHEAR